MHSSQPKAEYGLARFEPLARQQEQVVTALARLSPTGEESPATTQHRLALKYYASGDMAAALRHLQQAAELDPQSSVILFNLATLFYDRRDYSAAQEVYERCLAIDPTHYKARNNLGAILRAQGSYAEAIEQFRAAGKIVPDSVEVAQNLAAALHDAEQYVEAGTVYQQLHETHPDLEEAQRGLATCLERQGKLEIAGRLLAELADSHPHDLLANLRSDLLAPAVFPTVAAIDEYKRHLSSVLTRYETDVYTLDEAAIPASACKPPLVLAYYGQEVLRYKRALARAVARHVPTTPPLIPAGKPRVGFLATHRHEAVFLRGMSELIRNLPTGQFELYVITSQAGVRLASGALRNSAIHTVGLPQDFSVAVAALRSLQLDVLYFWEIGTDPTNYFLPFYRTAPVQCTSWGWPITSGITGVDYFISSELLEVPGADRHYSEQLIRFPKLPNVYLRPARQEFAWGRADFGLGAGEHIYLCPQNPLKLTPDMDKLFVEILQQDGAGRLLLLCGREAYVAEVLHSRLAAAAPEIADRIMFVPRTTSQQYLALVRAADVLLDTVHYSGGANTNCDALALAKPVVTLPTEFHRGRYTQAVYRQLGVTDTIASNEDDYVRIALRLANDRDFRDAISRQLAERSELIFADRSAIARTASFLEGAIAESRARK